MERSWIESFYDAQEFLFWEPQHIGKRRDPESNLDSYDKVSEHLRGMEVTLNQHISTFFLLAPQAFRQRLCMLLFGCRLAGKLHMHAPGVEERYGMVDSVQPDFFFTSRNSVLGVEMKIRAKSSVNQFLKYALLGLAEEIADGCQKEHFLGFLGRGAFAAQWKEGFRNPTELKKAAVKAAHLSFLRGHGHRFGAHLTRFRKIVAGLNIGSMTYGDLALFLERAQPPASDRSQGAGVYRKLIRGLVGELRERKLA